MTVEDFKKTIETGISDWFEIEKRSAPSAEAILLLERMSSLIKRGGKRVRPQLLFMTYSAYEGKYSDILVDLGIALEFHHQFLLIHDDIIDSDIIRYGGPNIVGYYNQDVSNQQNIPQAMGLLAGDLLFSFSNRAIIKGKNLTNKQKVTLLDMLNDANVGVGYGQQLDAYNIDVFLSSFTEEKLILIHSLKSALYSAQLPMQCAATVLDLNMAERDKINYFAKPFGILFQLVDDYSDYFHNNSAFNNRPKYRDFRQGKITYPLYKALTMATQQDAIFLRKHLGHKDLSDTTMEDVVSILKRCGAEKASREYLDQYFIQTYTAINQLSISPRSKHRFTAMVERYKL